ncbi:cysteine dioxygenase [Dyella agri]|uniref:Cysteine dioxygenase family protein n=1 Tax=Dyella agri TaxID=1926869 RepID=A0ABW8KKY7_9GAMM
MHDALPHSQSAGKPTLEDWSRRVQALIDDHLGRRAEVDVRMLAEALAAATQWPACPHLSSIAAGEALIYLRMPIAHRGSTDYEALLILWPPGHATPIHDHAGLWGLELVLDGVLEVETYALSPQPHPQLTSEGSAVLGVGDRASFSGANHAHRCRNFSSQKPALTLHVYGGALDTYRSFRQEEAGRWTSTVHRTHRTPAFA